MSDNFINLMVQRASHPRLVSPHPSSEVLEKIFQAALRAPDHMKLKPWRYLVITGQGLDRLGELFCQAALLDDVELSDAQQNKYLNMPKRAPMVIVGISSPQESVKVPLGEQVSSCAVGMGYMLLALQATGFGGMWRTGHLARHAHVKQGLSLQKHETIIGFLYLGTPQGKIKTLSKINSLDYFQDWL